MFFDGLFGINVSLGRSSKQMIEPSPSKKEFEFPSAEQLRQSNLNHILNLRHKCIVYIQHELKKIRDGFDLSETSSFLIPSDRNINDGLLLECTKEVLKGKGYDISPVTDGRSRGVAVKW